jgi:hypothetical protein
LPKRRIFLSESFKSFSAEVHDLSQGGIGLVFDQTLDPGTLLFIDLLGMEVPVEFLAKVIHATARPQGGYVIGCEFDRPLTPDEMNAVLARRAPKPNGQGHGSRDALPRP